MDLPQLFKGLSDPVRFRIAHLLTQEKELCVCHIIDALSLPQSTVSRQLNTLRHCGLVESERRGQWVYYRMLHANQAVASISDLMKHHALTNAQLQEDLNNLKDKRC